MRVTEEEARGKLCPMQKPQASCIGAGCMAWVFTAEMRGHAPGRKFVATPSPEKVEPVRPDGVPADWQFVPYDDDEGEPSGWVEPQEVCLARRIGHCGIVYKAEELCDQKPFL